MDRTSFPQAAVKAVELYTNCLINQQSISRVCVLCSHVKRFSDALMTFTVYIFFYRRVYLYCIVAVCLTTFY